MAYRSKKTGDSTCGLTNDGPVIALVEIGEKTCDKAHCSDKSWAQANMRCKLQHSGSEVIRWSESRSSTLLTAVLKYRSKPDNRYADFYSLTQNSERA